MNLGLRKIILMLSLALFFAGCTKSKESSGSAKPSTPPKADTPAPPTATPTPEGASTRDKEKKDDGKGDQIDNAGNVINFDEPLSQQQIDTMELEARKYSGSSPDSLREYLLQKFEDQASSTPTQRNKDLNFANRIVFAQLRVNDDKSGFKVILKVRDKDNKDKYLSFTGSTNVATGVIDSRIKKPITQLPLPRKIALKAIDKNGKEFKNQFGELECYDVGRVSMFDCNTKVASIHLNGANAKIIFRWSKLKINADFLGRSCATAQCQTVRDYLYNSEKEVRTSQRLKSAVMETFEILKGRSAFNILMVGHDLEVIKLEGNLPNEELFAPPALDTLLNQKLTSSEMKDPVTHQIRKTNLNKMLNDVRLQENDGRGGLRVKVRMALDKETGDIDDFDINFSRVMNAIRVQ